MFQHWRHRGASLIEILISLIVISVGMLAIAGLQIAQLHQTIQADTNYNLALRVIDIMDSIQANPIGVSDGDYNNISSSNFLATYPNTNCALVASGNGCNASQIAKNDARRWITAINKLLPGSTTSIQAVPSKPNTFLIQIQWTKDNKPYNYTQEFTI